MELGKLVAVFDADTKRFDAGLRHVQTKIGGAAKDIGKATTTTNQLTNATGSASSGLGIMGGALGLTAGAAIGATAAIGAAVAGIYKLATFSQQLGAEIFDLSQKINFSAETLSSLKVAAELSGGSLASLSTALGIFDRNMEEANDKSSEMSRIFKVLSIDTLDNEKALRQSFTALANMTSGAQQTALAMKLFGRSGKEVLGVVKETGGSVDDFIKKMEAMGLTITTSGSKKADKFGDDLKLLQLKLEAIARQIGTELVPTVEKAANDISNWLKANQTEIANTAKEIGTLISRIYEIANVIKNISPLILEIRIIKKIFESDVVKPWTDPSWYMGKGNTANAPAELPSGLPTLSPFRNPGLSTFGSPFRLSPQQQAAANARRAQEALERQLRGAGAGGGRGGGGGGRRATKSVGEDFDEYYNLFDFLKKAEEERLDKAKQISDELERQRDRMYDILNSTLQINQEAMEFGPVATATRDLEKFMEIEPPEISDQTKAILAMREKMRDLGHELTGIFADSIGVGFEQGAKRGLVTLAQGLLDIVQNVFLKRLAEGLGNILADLSSGSGGTPGWLKWLVQIGGAAAGGVGGGAATGGAGSAMGGAMSGIRFAQGGFVPGADKGFDSVHGMLTPGELVLNKRQQGMMGQVVNNYTINLPPSPKGGYTSPKSQRELGDKLLAMLQGSQT